MRTVASSTGEPARTSVVGSARVGAKIPRARMVVTADLMLSMLGDVGWC